MNLRRDLGRAGLGQQLKSEPQIKKRLIVARREIEYNFAFYFAGLGPNDFISMFPVRRGAKTQLINYNS